MVAHEDKAPSAEPLFGIRESRLAVDKEVLTIASHVHGNITLIAHYNIIVCILVEEVVQADIAINVFVVIILFNIQSMCPRVGCKLSNFITLKRRDRIDHFHILNRANFNLNFFILLI
jgi:hypothetical protein